MGCCNKKNNAGQPDETLEDVEVRVQLTHSNNILSFAAKQKNLLKWLKNGIVGNIKYYTGDKSYSDSDIEINQKTCIDCEYRSGKDKSKDILLVSDKCLGLDPEQGGAPCGCPIYKKIVTGKCPLDKWKTTPLTINNT